MHKDEIMLKAANPDLDEGRLFATLLDRSAEGFIRFWLGRNAVDLVATAFIQLDSIEDRAIASGSARLALDVSAKNERARSLYEHRGMAIESQWPKRLPISGLRFYRMTKALQALNGYHL